ncbi:ABC transporter permease [Natronococcus sp. A-GB1]|uniref:ABC transporter permease n=1 Tax=Natronococcus sp. A-GB1 TaxID=3037648 RepID=UPI00241D083D|nr:ABC transporter permease [Natronococcus sp. A-GB1]MDG5759267.1 ABC transporter permease [Natronococcus sp. A-GB1]
MSVLRLLVKRIALGLVAAWAVLTVTFLAFTTSRDWVAGGIEGTMRYEGASEAEVELALEEYLAIHGLDRPLWEQYVDWIGSMLTLDWGRAFFIDGESGSEATLFEPGAPVFQMVIEATARTVLYVGPALVLALAAGTAIGLYAASNPKGRLANSSSGTTYLLFAVPNFWIGGMALSLAAAGRLPDSTLVFEHLLPITLTATTLLGAYVSYARAHALEYASAEFVTLVRAKGAGPIRVARHVLRNAAIPLFSMVFTEALALLVLTVFVIESLFTIEGFGLLLFEAVQLRDLPVVLGCTLVIIAVGIAGNVVQDLTYTILDPRVDTDSR